MTPKANHKKISLGRVIPIVLGLLLAGSAVFAVSFAQTARAQEVLPPEPPPTINANPDDPGTFFLPPAPDPTNYVETTAGPAQAVPAPAANSTAANAPTDSAGCGFIASFAMPVTCALITFARTIGNTVLAGMSSLVWLSGKLLDMSMYFTIHMADILRQMSVVEAGWAVFRDLANMVFIFVLLYIAIATILNLANTKQMLVTVIITAFLINFSLFISKAVVDVSNVVALQFYDRLNSLPSNDPADPYKGPSAALRNAMKIATIYAPPKTTQNADTSWWALAKELLVKGDEIGAFLIKVAMGSVVLLITSFIFATGAILLFVRIITLMFLMMISPLAFIARILPRTQGMWDKWWKALINNAIFAPVWLAMLYVVISTASNGLPGLPGGTGTGSFANLFTGDSASLNVLFNYIFIVILLIGTIIVSKSIGLYGATAIMNTSKAAAKNFGGFAGRHTIGRAARVVKDSEAFKSAARSFPTAGYFAFKGLNATEKASWGGKKGGYSKYAEREAKNVRDYATHVAPGAPGAAGGGGAGGVPPPGAGGGGGGGVPPRPPGGAGGPGAGGVPPRPGPAGGGPGVPPPGAGGGPAGGAGRGAGRAPGGGAGGPAGGAGAPPRPGPGGGAPGGAGAAGAPPPGGGARGAGGGAGGGPAGGASGPGTPPRVQTARNSPWWSAGFNFVDEAKEWNDALVASRNLGVNRNETNRATVAKLWHDMGYTPEEAQAQIKKGNVSPIPKKPPEDGEDAGGAGVGGGRGGGGGKPNTGGGVLPRPEAAGGAQMPPAVPKPEGSVGDNQTVAQSAPTAQSQSSAEGSQSTENRVAQEMEKSMRRTGQSFEIAGETMQGAAKDFGKAGVSAREAFKPGGTVPILGTSSYRGPKPPVIPPPTISRPAYQQTNTRWDSEAFINSMWHDPVVKRDAINLISKKVKSGTSMGDLQEKLEELEEVLKRTKSS